MQAMKPQITPTPAQLQAMMDKGPDGAIVSEFSTRSTDEHDVFTDPRVTR